MKSNLRKAVLICLAFLLSNIGTFAQDRLFVYRNNGIVDGFLYSEIQSISCSRFDTAGVYHSDYISQEILTNDSTCLIPLEEIDSISFHAPSIIYKEGVKKLDGIRKYVVSATNTSILLSPSIPTSLIPEVGTKIVTLQIDDLFPMGFAGEIIEVERRVDGCVNLLCTPVGLEDIFYSYYYSFNGDGEGNENYAKARRSPESPESPNDGKFVIPINDISSSYEFELGDETKIANFPVEVSGKLKASINCLVLTIQGYDMVVPDRGHVRHVSMEGDFTTEESFSIGVSKEKKQDFPFPIIGHFEAPTGIPFLSYYYEFGAFYRLSGSITAGVEFKQNWHLEYAYNSSENKQPAFKIVPKGSDKAEGPICLKGSAAAGVYGEIGIKPVAVDKIGKVAGRFEAGIEISAKGYDVNDLITAGYSTSLYDEIISDPFLNMHFYESLSVTAKVGPLKNTWEIFKGKLGAEFVLGSQVPSFSDVVCNRVGESDNVRVTSKIGLNCILPFKTGFALFDNANHKVSTTYYDKTYYKNNYTSFGVEIANARKDNKYKIYPVINILGYEMLCNPSVDVKGNFDVQTIETESVGKTSAVIAGYVEGEHTEHGMRYYSPTSHSWVLIKASGNAAGNYSASITGLTPKTEYRYSAYIVVEGVTYYGDILTFKTGYDEEPTITPKVITGNSSAITSTSAIIECGYQDIPEEAVCGYNIYAQTSSLIGGISENPIGRVEGSRTIPLNNLTPSTTYCYSAYVYYNGRYYDGVDRYFTTKTPESQADISNISATTATIHCTYENVPDGASRGFYFWNDELNYGYIENSDYLAKELEIGKTYYVQPSVRYGDLEYSSEVYSFTTLLPQAITGKVTDITSYSANCFASFENVPEGGTCYLCLRYTAEGDYTYVVMSPEKNVSQDWKDLTAGHKYDYWAVIVYDGKEYAGEELSFSTKDIPVELSNFSVTKAEWKRKGFEYNGNSYAFKFNTSITAKLTDASNIEDWGDAYVDPDGGHTHISLADKGNYYIDTRYAYCRNEPEASVILYGYVKYRNNENRIYNEGWEFPLIYDEEPSITYQSAEILSVDGEPQYDGDGVYLFTWYTTKFKYVIKITGGYWIDNIQPMVYDNGSWSYNGGKAHVPGDGLYSATTNMNYDDTSNMNWSTGYNITLTNGSTMYSSNTLQFGGTPESPTISVGGSASRAAKSRKSIKQTEGKLNVPTFGELIIEEIK